MKYAYLLLSFLLFQTSVGESFYELELKTGQWKVKPALFYISSVVDERSNKEKTGQALVNNQLIPVRFKNTIESDLMAYINGSVSRDTTLIPLIFSIKKFEIKETGTTSNHKASFDFAFEFSRELNGKRYRIYESKGNPILSMRGPYERPHEKNITESIENVIMNFNEWLNSNSDQPPMARSAEIIMNNSRLYQGDTLAWKDDYKLKWSDFKGTKYSGPFMAQSNCIFDYRVEPIMKNGVLKLHMNLTACFERKSSWVKKDAQQDGLLKHEQLHFDICELNIRKIKKEMQSLILDPMEFDEQLKVVFQRGWEEYQKEQQLYDTETKHGIVEVEQKRWEEDVEERIHK